MVPSGAFVTVDLAGVVTGLQTTTDLEAAIATELGQVPFVVRSVRVVSPDLVTALLSGQWYHYRYSARVVVQTQTAYAQLDDVRSIVFTVFYDATGSTPSGSSIVVAGGDTPPGAEPPDAGSLSWFGSWFGSLGDAIAGLGSRVAGVPADVGRAVQTDVQILIVGVVVVAAVGVAVLAWKK